MSELSEVLAAHRMIGFNDTDAHCSACEWRSTVSSPCWEAHLAAAVNEWLRERLAAADVREAVAVAMFGPPNLPPNDTTRHQRKCAGRVLAVVGDALSREGRTTTALTAEGEPAATRGTL